MAAQGQFLSSAAPRACEAQRLCFALLDTPGADYTGGISLSLSRVEQSKAETLSRTRTKSSTGEKRALRSHSSD